MECSLCVEHFDQDARRPKVLPCGHTICLACLLQLKQHNCPNCRKALPKGSVNNLPDNYTVLQIMENEVVRERQPECRCSWWCSTCQAVAKASCKDEGHPLLDPRAALRQQVAQVQEQLPQLQQEVHEQLQALAAADTAEDKALAGLQCLGGLGSLGTSCEVVLRRDGGPSYEAKWSVSEAALKNKLLRALALVLVQDGELTQQEEVQAGSGPQHQDQQRAQQVARVARGPRAGIDKLDVGDALNTEDKVALLRRVRQQGVRRMSRVWCHNDPAWSLELLLCAAPMLEELKVSIVSPEHLLAVHGMQRLRKLFVGAGAQPFNEGNFPAALPPLPADHAGLQWLNLNLPRQPTIALLKAHGHSLQELGLFVGTGRHEDGWPRGCEDLPALLQQCGLRALRRLYLWRPSHPVSECTAQRASVRRVLRGVTVECKQCDEVYLQF